MQYVYGCKNKEHPTKILIHSWREVVFTLCEICDQPMHKIPQPFRLNVPLADSGQRNAKEIYGHLKSKGEKNKARREAGEAARRHAQEKEKANANKY